jgi:hypothetical protein
MAGLAKKVWSSLAAQSDATHSAICVGMKICRWTPTLPISSFRIDKYLPVDTVLNITHMVHLHCRRFSSCGTLLNKPVLSSLSAFFSPPILLFLIYNYH